MAKGSTEPSGNELSRLCCGVETERVRKRLCLPLYGSHHSATTLAGGNDRRGNQFEGAVFSGPRLFV